MEHLNYIMKMEAYLIKQEVSLTNMEMIHGHINKEDLIISLEINLAITMQLKVKFLMILIEIDSKDLL